jgi:hypothetical protein
MQTDAGRKMQDCMKAVRRMHSSAGKLLKDFDKLVPWPSTSVFQNTATKDLTYATNAAYWMADGVFRYLSCKSNPSLVEAITICFLDDELDEPVLLLGRLEYAQDLWYMHFPLRSSWNHGVAQECIVPEDRAVRIQRAVSISVPLYSIARVSDVSTLLEKIRSVQGVHG